VQVGIMADSHDNLPRIHQAVEFFNEQGVALVFHAGDFIAPFVGRELRHLTCPVVGVFGNNDGERTGLRSMMRELGEIHDPPYFWRHNEFRVLLSHVPPGEVVLEESADVVIWGHTHEPVVRREVGRLLVNPGECGGWLTGRATVAWADLASREVRIQQLSDSVG